METLSEIMVAVNYIAGGWMFAAAAFAPPEAPIGPVGLMGVPLIGFGVAFQIMTLPAA